ncbi:hypothetical protein SAMN04515618_1189 [Collimonas sp. OK307]|uniref:hypothetical protein n=1 Tax=Collimonas sp. OK307 TaxID=1801620 RepID=UPI0008E498AE|nr:hypothetical protein [Collimonas sp. OK307]SFI33717.1 hypothetical protein SAMN04515618_1189 [Collimonas sp. OK307]
MSSGNVCVVEMDLLPAQPPEIIQRVKIIRYRIARRYGRVRTASSRAEMEAASQLLLFYAASLLLAIIAVVARYCRQEVAATTPL